MKGTYTHVHTLFILYIKSYFFGLHHSNFSYKKIAQTSTPPTPPPPFLHYILQQCSSDHFSLTLDPPQIIQDPEKQSVPTGTDIIFSVEAAGDDLQFQWQKNGQNIDSNESRFSPSQTNGTSTLQIQCVKKSDKGHYKCLVKNPVKQKLSSEVELEVCKCVLFMVFTTIQLVHFLPISYSSSQLILHRSSKVQKTSQ